MPWQDRDWAKEPPPDSPPQEERMRLTMDGKGFKMEPDPDYPRSRIGVVDVIFWIVALLLLRWLGGGND